MGSGKSLTKTNRSRLGTYADSLSGNTVSSWNVLPFGYAAVPGSALCELGPTEFNRANLARDDFSWHAASIDLLP
jgi:hypothetical protein